MRAPLSILDLATVSDLSAATETLRGSVTTARRADDLGFLRYWFAEHHNMPSILSSAPSVLIAHIAAHTERIRVGAGGVMLPNHSPLVIAEQFGTLETLYPGRIDLGVGRAPGGDRDTAAALRRDAAAAGRFPHDVHELRELLGPAAHDRRVQAIPGAGTEVPIYVLGSSLFGARLAASLGLPYAFASHFAPAALIDALRVYRDEFQPSGRFAQPYVIAAMNVFAADTADAGRALFEENLRRMARNLLDRSDSAHTSVDDDTLLVSPLGQQVREMLRHTAVGDGPQVRAGVEDFVKYTEADEVMVASNIIDTDARLRSYEILAEAMEL